MITPIKVQLPIQWKTPEWVHEFLNTLIGETESWVEYQNRIADENWPIQGGTFTKD